MSYLQTHLQNDYPEGGGHPKGGSTVPKIQPMTGLLAAISGAAIFTHALAAAPAISGPQMTAAGLWERVDSSGAPAAWFRILDCNGIYQGKMARIFSTPGGPNPSEWRCTGCAGNQRNAPVIGLTFINGMRRNGLAYEGGSILDPRTGSVYSARMDLSADGQQLSVRGYLAIELLGQTEVWRRLPDNAMPPGRFAACS
jgi:uncharacterized protein (DUF2147 family)